MVFIFSHYSNLKVWSVEGVSLTGLGGIEQRTTMLNKGVNGQTLDEIYEDSITDEDYENLMSE